MQLPSSGIIEKPSVQYCGIFLNDEDWGLEPWAFDSIDQNLKKWVSRGFTPKIFEELSAVMNEYYRLHFIRKPEYLSLDKLEYLFCQL